MLAEIIHTQIARTAAHVIAVLREHGISVVTGTVEERKQSVPPRPPHLAIAQIFEQRLAVYERTCSGAQHHDLTIQLRLLGDRAQQVIVLDLPTAICVGARQYPIGYESVGFGLKTH